MMKGDFYDEDCLIAITNNIYVNTWNRQRHGGR